MATGDLASVTFRLNDADNPAAGKRVVHQCQIAWLEYVERKRGAWQQDYAAQRKHRDIVRQVFRFPVAIGYPN